MGGKRPSDLYLMLCSVYRLFTNGFRTLPLPPANYFAGKTVLITGSNTGLGREAARLYANLGAAKIILGVRSIEKGNDAVKDIETTSGRKVLDVWQLDMEDYSSIKEFAKKAATLERLDIAVMNAGLANSKFYRSKEGNEMQVQVNVLSTALLSLLLLPKLVEARQKFPDSIPHLTVVGSEIHEEAHFVERNEKSILDALNDESRFKEGDMEGYSMSKLLLQYVVGEIARLTPSIDAHNTLPAVVVNSIAPGFCKSNLIRSGEKALIFIQNTLGRPTVKGATTIVSGSVQGESSHGKYHYNCKPVTPGYYVTSEEGQKAGKRVWADIIERLAPVAPEIKTLAKI